MARLRAILVRVLIAGLIGAVVTVGVAVGCAMSEQPGEIQPFRPENWRDPRTGTVYAWVCLKGGPIGRLGVVGVSVGARTIIEGAPVPRGLLTELKPTEMRLVRTAGWPCECVWGGLDNAFPTENCYADSPRVPNPPLAAVRAIGIGRTLSTGDQRGVGGYLPIAPIWSGLTINTLFYATIAFALLFMPGAIRRWRRSRTGRCVRCGYDLKGLPAGAACPECGGAGAR